MATVIPNTTSNVQATINNAVKSTVDNNSLASNFQTFLTLLTTQLKNQNPLDPLDTNQFTQQLVQFAQVEQQIKQNTQLETLISIEKSAQATTALAYVGATVAIDGQTAALKNGQATWTFNVPKPVTSPGDDPQRTGQTVYTGSFSMNAGHAELPVGRPRHPGRASGRTATTPSRSPARTPAARPWRSRARSKASSIPSTSPRRRRSSRSAARPSRSTRSSAWCGRPRDLSY